ncbi:AIM24 family protein [Streptomyces sp. NPDC049881]|uniref:AIM24 family protein n=1 Tax=Streptomyces sp. NPDC049881 TaxID=3155778 RepID=UPI00342F10F2
MQSPIFHHTVDQTQERFAPQGAQMLRVALGHGEDVLARTGSMVAFEGMVEFDGEYQPPGRQHQQWAAGEALPLMRCHGQGAVYLAHLAQHVHVLDVDHEGLTVDSSYVLALDPHLHWDVVAVESQYGIAGAGAYNLVISGRGKVALTTSGRPLVMRVSPEGYCGADADAVVAWSSSLRVQMQAQTSTSSVWRRRGNTGEAWELNFMGQGHVVVQPSELLPPTHTSFGQQIAGQFRPQQPAPGAPHGGSAWGR